MPSQRTQPPINRAPPLPIAQSTAVSDIDGDHLPDRVTVNGAGPSESIKVCLSHNHSSAVLSFYGLSIGTGALLASDVDQEATPCGPSHEDSVAIIGVQDKSPSCRASIVEQQGTSKM